MLAIDGRLPLFHLNAFLEFQNNLLVVPVRLNILLFIQYLVDRVRVKDLPNHVEEEVRQ